MKKKTMTCSLTVALALAGIFTSEAQATVIFTEESDFSGDLESPFIVPGSLGVGADTITGSLPAGFLYADRDTFQVNNPSLLSISSITITITNYIGTTTDPQLGRRGTPVAESRKGIYQLGWCLHAQRNIER
jgi:hypothetical protein